jgi:predicted dehydrogenase
MFVAVPPTKSLRQLTPTGEFTMRNLKRWTRRRFLKNTTLTAAACAAPWILPARARGANERIVRGHICVGNRGKDHVNYAGPVAAVCDIDQRQLKKIQQQILDKGNACDAYQDYRRLLDRKDIDAVVICPPDHWHALIFVAACEAGKQIYVEKPLSLTIDEGRKMVQAARKNKCIVQVGSQQRTDPRFAFACDLARNGKLGGLSRVEVGLPAVSVRTDAVPDTNPPDWLDYNAWLGPAPYRPYNPHIVHVPWREWRWCWDFSGGNMTNWGAHHLDIAQWGMGTDATGPVEINGRGEFDPDKKFSVPANFEVTYRYANGVEVVAGSKNYRSGTTFIGKHGRVSVDRGKIESDPAEILKTTLPNGSLQEYEAAYQSKNHFGDWLECIRSGQQPAADIEVGHRSVTVCHLGNISIRLGRAIRWDPAGEQILDDDEASQMMSRPYRAPWTL